MQATDNFAANIATSPQSFRKRKLSTLHESQPAAPPKLSTGQPGPKRLKTVHSTEDLSPGRRPEDMNKGKGVMVSRSMATGGLRGPMGFQSHSGVKRLVIQNLKTPRPTEKYYEEVWNGLEAALTSIYNEEEPKIPREVLSKNVEIICRRTEALKEKLSSRINERNKAYLQEDIVPQIESLAGSSPVQILRAVYAQWKKWIAQVTLMRAIFSFLDRSYHRKVQDVAMLEDQTITQFRQIVLNLGRIGQKSETLGCFVVKGVCDLIQSDREGDDALFDAILLRDAISMLHICNIYRQFESEFIEHAEEYFQNYASDQTMLSIDKYIEACDKLIDRESSRCDAYNLDSSTKKHLLERAYLALIEQRSEKLLDTRGVDMLIKENMSASLQSLYKLLSLSKIQEKLLGPWETYIKPSGSTIVSDRERINEMVVRLLELKKKLDNIIRDAFGQDERFTHKLRESFGNFMNDSANTAALGKEAGNSKVGEMIAKYMDLLLRNGAKAVPRSLATDTKDRDAAEKLGQSSTGDEDAELDRNLEQGLELFRFIEAKDVFEAFYKKDLAKRLLMGRSASQDAERNMLAKLKNECGYAFTHNLETMFKDQELAKEEMVAYKSYQLNMLQEGKQLGLDLQVSVLSSTAWPLYPDVEVKLPVNVARQIEKYDVHYKHNHSGRKLAWKHALAHSIVKAQFNKGAKELILSGFQAVVLVLFNDIGVDGNLSYTDLQDATGLVDAELMRTLQSLACTKIKILNKHPKSRDVRLTDTFTFNAAFIYPKFRIKINQIQLQETKEEVETTHERVYQDRQYETQAAIVRIMKARKEMTHSGLVAEVINQTKKRGEVEVGEIKKNIEKLIDKEYIEREEGSYVYLA
ncbi:Cullin family-domain-containing protein [Calycina marina]|uniref:Cullin family-domain-containing protein n=1 Tax=Calycina marina TaxID=1763456 RepID=A0A9P7Z4U1_9HELO|nr:Cullin family-domain-containing protein [Calycina marina]